MQPGHWPNGLGSDSTDRSPMHRAGTTLSTPSDSNPRSVQKLMAPGMGGLAMSAPLVVDDLVGVLVLGLGVDVGGGTTCSLTRRLIDVVSMVG